MEVQILNVFLVILIHIYQVSNVFSAIIHGYLYFNIKLILNKVQTVQQEHHQIALIVKVIIIDHFHLINAFVIHIIMIVAMHFVVNVIILGLLIYIIYKIV